MAVVTPSFLVMAIALDAGSDAVFALVAVLVPAPQVGTVTRLVGAAGLSVLAHLEELVARGAVATDGPPAIGGTYRLAG